ncbi:hypothetical protein SISSUDRAFT_1053934 [Sistotremastrum suecicum HHB10207 ss-3]|uniref:Uncharacterized protein n=1 Tax=Sistotremastrum suecicum HHB10207 ss-3 TaxID=1314776 RepID=A0A165YWN1_9AGAM|nr:hypothetical protein SISSUDRAFT_1053934 [Sistotremastrum suecicum HHB10207 ss-3]
MQCEYDASGGGIALLNSMQQGLNQMLQTCENEGYSVPSITLSGSSGSSGSGGGGGSGVPSSSGSCRMGSSEPGLNALVVLSIASYFARIF